MRFMVKAFSVVVITIIMFISGTWIAEPRAIDALAVEILTAFRVISAWIVWFVNNFEKIYQIVL